MAAACTISPNKLRIGVVSTRSGTTDGVSLETEKRTHVMKRVGHECFFIAGLCEWPSTTADGRKAYSLWDFYPFADIVTYPSLLEGFGYAFLEAVYFRRPVVVNHYTIDAIDIQSKGFRAIELDGFITEEAVIQVEQVLAPEMAEHNYQLAKRFIHSPSFTGEEVRT